MEGGNKMDLVALIWLGLVILFVVVEAYHVPLLRKTDNLYAQGAFAMVHIFLAHQKPFFFNPKSSEIDRISTGQIPPVGVQ